MNAHIFHCNLLNKTSCDQNHSLIHVLIQPTNIHCAITMCELSAGNRIVSKNLSVISRESLTFGCLKSGVSGLLSMNFHSLAFQF